MRKNVARQLPLVPACIEHEHAQELRKMSELLDALPRASSLVQRDLLAGADRDVGRPGMTGEQALRALLVKQMNGWSYERLAFHLADSSSYRAFCRIGVAERPPSRSTLQGNLKRIGAETLRKVNGMLLREAARLGLEDGSVVRIDSTVVESNIHHPNDSSLLFDAVRILSRQLKQVAQLCPIRLSDHTKRARRRAMAISNAKGMKRREPLYRDLLQVAGWTLGYAQGALQRLAHYSQPRALQLRDQLQHNVTLATRIIDQTQRRVFEGQSVAASDKVVSMVESHTDVIVKGGREVEYGHKAFLSVGRSSMVLDLVIERGNPADVTRVQPLLQRHQQQFGCMPRQASFDAGFTSNGTVELATRLGIEAAFARRSGVDVSRAVTNSWLYRQLMRFRAGIEGVISFLKHSFGLERCSWRGYQSCQAYAWASALAANVLIAARLAMA